MCYSFTRSRWLASNAYIYIYVLHFRNLKEKENKNENRYHRPTKPFYWNSHFFATFYLGQSRFFPLTTYFCLNVSLTVDLTNGQLTPNNNTPLLTQALSGEALLGIDIDSFNYFMHKTHRLALHSYTHIPHRYLDLPHTFTFNSTSPAHGPQLSREYIL